MTGAIYKMDQPMNFALGAKTNFTFVTVAVRVWFSNLFLFGIQFNKNEFAAILMHCILFCRRVERCSQFRNLTVRRMTRDATAAAKGNVW